MQATEAANKGSTRALYLSWDGSRSGGGGAFVPDWRRSIIPRVYRCCFDDVELTIPRHTRRDAVFCNPLGLAGLLASKPTGEVLEPEDGLSLNDSFDTRDVCKLP